MQNKTAGEIIYEIIYQYQSYITLSLYFICYILCGYTPPFSEVKHREYTTLAEKYQFALEDAGIHLVEDKGEGIINTFKNTDISAKYFKISDAEAMKYAVSRFWGEKFETDYSEVNSMLYAYVTDTSSITKIYVYEFADEKIAQENFKYAADMYENHITEHYAPDKTKEKSGSDYYQKALRWDNIYESREVFMEENYMVAVMYKTSSKPVFIKNICEKFYAILERALPINLILED